MYTKRLSLFSMMFLIPFIIGMTLVGLLTSQPTHAAPNATHTVTNLNDSGVGSLRQAISQAAAGDTIDFNVSGLITLTSGALVIDKSLIIDGGSVITVSGNHATRVFIVTADNVTFDNLSIISGTTTVDGAGIYNRGILTVNNSTLSGNSASDGGGIYNNGILTVSNSTLSSNSAFNGGGIYNHGGTLNVSNSTLSSNSANYGGGIANNGGTLSVTNSTLSGNSVGDYGGGIVNYGTFTITNSTLSDNSANWGGGIFNHGNLTVTNSTLSDNSANWGGGIINSDGTLSVTSSTLSGNSAVNYGGGIINHDTFTITDSTLSDNSADIGGSIYNYGTLTVTNSTISGNSAYNGGGIANNGGTLNVTNSNLSGNSANYGGSIYNNSGTLTIMNSTLSGNSAVNYGGGIYNHGTFTITDSTLSDNSAEVGGSIYNYGTLTITDSTFSENSVDGNGGGIFNHGNLTVTGSTLSDNSAGEWGGGIANSTSGIVTVINSTLSGNLVRNDGGGIANSGTLTVSNSILSDNSADYGGGILNLGTLTVTNSTLSDNSAIAASGGGIYNGGTLTISSSTLSNNSADYGGGIYNDPDGTLTGSNSTLSGNSANSEGGGIYNGGPLTVTNSTLSGNSAGSEGGGIASMGVLNVSTTLANTIVSGNNISNTATANDLSLVWWEDDSFSSGGHNLIGVIETGITAFTNGVNGDQTSVNNPLLAPLANNGGGTMTHALLAGSPAIDAGNCSSGPATDQRGVPRPIGTACDIGAFESNAYLLTIGVIGSGTVTQDPEADIEYGYQFGTAVTVTAAADIGWEFAGWSGDLSGTALTETVVITGNMAITATFSNDPPTADAGGDQLVEVNQTVALDGSGSFDVDPSQTLTYGWTQTGGTAVSLSDTTAVSPTFTAPATPTILTFTLTVTDNLGLASTPSTAVITVNDVVIGGLTAVNSSPTTLGQTTYLTASVSTGSNIVYSWDLGDGNSGIGATLSHVYVTVGSYTATVTTTNSVNIQVATTLVTITNNPPIADAGGDQLAETNQTVTLDGSGSTDSDDHLPLIYNWTQTGGTAVSLSDTTAVSPTFTAPATADILTFSLVVTDSMGATSAPDEVIITVQEPGLAAALTASPTTARPGDVVQFTLTLTNTGDLTLSNLSSVTTAAGNFTLPDSLDPGATISATTSYTVQAADLPGPLTNVVTVTTQTPLGEGVNALATTAVALERHTLFLPIVLNNYVSAPDLVVTDVVVAHNNVTVILTNEGNTPVVDPFWVDVYLNPTIPPTAVNQTWQMLGTEGLVWGVEGAVLPLLPGQSITLTLDDSYYQPDQSVYSSPIASGTAVYAQVDSAQANVDYGAVLESHEITNAPYNNIFGPLFVP